MAQKRTIDSFFSTKTDSNNKKPRTFKNTASEREIIDHENAPNDTKHHTQLTNPSSHSTYPFPIAGLPSDLSDDLDFTPAFEARVINNYPDLDLLYYQPYIPASIQRRLFYFLRQSLPFYRVKYTIRRGQVETQINTPRFTTVFGVDSTSFWSPTQNPSASTHDTSTLSLTDTATNSPIPRTRYRCRPRPLPSCLRRLLELTQAATGETFNFCLVNYYASGEDSISYHADDERFLGPAPVIASLSLGAKRDFCLKQRAGPGEKRGVGEAVKMPLASGDMVVMRGKTQEAWLHAVPKRKGVEADGGRINITFRRAIVVGGTENYYSYNVGSGVVYRWDEKKREMVPWEG